MPIRTQGYGQQVGGREGTSSTRYNQQHGTHAAGQMHNGTPATRDNGYGDHTVTMETSTVGQARKDVTVPERDDDEPDNSYLGQAKAMASQAYDSTTAAVGAASHSVMAAAGYGDGEDHQAANEGMKQQQQQHRPSQQQHDPRVDKMQNHDVEDYIRNQYVSTNRMGQRKIDLLRQE